MGQQWYMKRGDEVIGPITTKILKQAAASGSLRPADLISNDGQRFVPAARARGLAFADQSASSPALSIASPPSSFERKPSNTDALVASHVPLIPTATATSPTPAGFSWPIIRVYRPSWPRKWQAALLDPSGVSFLRSRGPLTDELLAEAGKQGKNGGWTTIARDEIRSVSIKQIGLLSADSLWRRYTVKSSTGIHRILVAERDSPHFIAALKQLAGDRFDERARKRPSAGESLLILFLSIDLLGMAAIAGAFGVAAWLATVCLFLALIRWDLYRSEFRLRPAGPRRKPRRSLQRKAFRSPACGWGLKALGLASIVMVYVFGPLAVSRWTIPELRQVANQALIAFYAPGILAIWIGYRLCLNSFAPQQHPDPRQPILFLRAFDDDGRMTFQPGNLLAALHGIFRFRDFLPGRLNAGVFAIVIHPAKLLRMFLNAETNTAEELLGAAFRACGPFVAIGRPGEVLATPGADRMYVADADWQGVVLDYLDRSQAVVLQPAQTDGVRWEIEHVFARLPRHRLLLSMLNFKDRPNDYEDFRAWIRAAHGVQLPLALPFENAPSFVYFEPNGSARIQQISYRSPLIWTFAGNAVNVQRTFHSFIQGLHGGIRNPPAPAAKHPCHAILSLPMLVAFWCAVYFVINSALDPIRSNVLAVSEIALEDVSHGISTIAGDDPSAQLVLHKGRAMPYEFRLSTDWRPQPIPADAKRTEYLFSYRLGSLEARAGDVKFLDIHRDSVASELRAAYEKRAQDEAADRLARKEFDNQITVSVKVRSDRWITIHGIDWREIVFEQSYGIATTEIRRTLMYSSTDGFVVFDVLLPDYRHFEKFYNEFIQTIHVPGNEQDQLLREAREQPQILHRGTKLPYRWSLPAVWTPNAERPEERVRAVVGEQATDLKFDLGRGGLAKLESDVSDETIDFGKLHEYGEETAEQLAQVLAALMPEAKPKAELVAYSTTRRGPTLWATYEILITFTTKAGNSVSVVNLMRVTNVGNRSLTISATVQRRDPVVMRLTTEAIDAVEIEP